LRNKPTVEHHNHPIDGMFHPRSVAVIGASDKEDNWAAKGFLKPVIDFGFTGGIYPINPQAAPVLGFKAYSRVTAVPEPVDFAIVSVPKGQVFSCIEDCAVKGVKTVCVYAAGFSENGTEQGRDEEALIIYKARAAGMRILGPNCIGIYCPEGQLTFNAETPKEAGHVGLIAQSGRYSSEFIALCAQRGLRFSKAISYGNGADINETELLDHLGKDDDTHLVASYMEGIKGGKRFAEVLRRVAPIKPVIITKGGFTEAGRRAARSHTASLTGSEKLWRALLQQAGAISANDLEEMSDLAMTFELIPNLKGNRIAVVGAGGGASVLVSDFLTRAGFTLPTFGEDIQKQLHQFVPLSGTGVLNPVDFSPQTSGDPVLTPMAVDVVGKLEMIDLVLVHYSLGHFNSTRAGVQQFCQGIIESSKKLNKPVVVALEWLGYPDNAALAFEIKQQWIKAGICVFPSLSRAALCLGKRAAWPGVRE